MFRKYPNRISEFVILCPSFSIGAGCGAQDTVQFNKQPLPVFETDSLMCYSYMYARETESNWSTAEGEWETLLCRFPAGWGIAELDIHPNSCETTYIDNGGGHDYVPCPPFYFRSVGDTGGNDIGGVDPVFRHCATNAKEII